MDSDNGAHDASRPLLSCRGISKYFGAMAAIKDLDFDVLPGEVLGIGGPNGAGKTTLFDVISGVTPADGGSLEFDGVQLLGKSAHEICHRGIVRTFQLDAVFDTLTVKENILCASYFGSRNVFFPKVKYDSEAVSQADAAIELTRLGDFADMPANQLPVLQRKLLMIASAISMRPKLLLLDEPVGGLTPPEIDQVLELVNELRRVSELPIVVIEHVMRFLVALSDRIMIMHHGEKIYEGSARGLAQNPTVVEVYLGKGATARLQHMVDAEEGTRTGV